MSKTPEIDSKKDSAVKNWQIFLVISGLVAVIWLSVWLIVPAAFPDFATAGQSGDMFGSVNALFSGLAFAGLIATLIMQRQELELQRKELELSRNEFGMQRFETVFFNLLRLFNEHVLTIKDHHSIGAEMRGHAVEPNGRAALTKYSRRLPDQLYSDTRPDGMGGNFSVQSERNLDSQIEIYENQFKDTLEPQFGPYFRLLYNVMRHVENSELSEDEKVKYARIVRAYLNSSDIKILMFHCSSKISKNFVLLVIKHSLLKHLHAADAKNNIVMYLNIDALAFEGRRHGVDNPSSPL